MKRDMDLIRKIVLTIEDDPKYNGVSVWQGNDDFSKLTGATEEEVGYNLTLLVDAGLVNGKSNFIEPLFRSLSWDGHDFADSVRDPEIWRRTKDGVKAAGGFSFDLLKALAKGFIKKKIEDHTGIVLRD